jgi:endonuclease/exonuclease/phosphatase (EEP) superfamily protein YafD
METFSNLALLIAAGAGLGALLGFLGRIGWPFELFSHFRLQYTFLLAAATLPLLANGDLLAAGLSAGIAAVNLGLILPLYRRPASLSKIGRSYRVLLCNVLQDNRQYDRVLALVQAANADFVVLLEVGEAWMEALQPLLADYPHYINEFWGEENYDLALFSRLPMTWAETRYFDANQVPSLVARFSLDGQPLTLVATHPAPPKSRRQARYRDEQMAAIARFVRQQTGAVMVAGDLNMTSWAPAFQKFTCASGLRDSRPGFGVQPTWQAGLPFPLIPIDHILISSEIAPHRRVVGPYVGSDHHPVILDFSLEGA